MQNQKRKRGPRQVASLVALVVLSVMMLLKISSQLVANVQHVYFP